MKNIGFIGLGNMGKGMAINLSLNDYNIMGYDINPNVFDDLSEKKIAEGKND
jgi:3-hydroxyisobutyrate dehydrogenase and related beta-hydroxyacid dehydrogenases